MVTPTTISEYILPLCGHRFTFGLRRIRSDWSRFADTNACGIDWNALSVADYITASTKNAEIVAGVVAQFIITVNRAGIPYDQISIAGHSLGAHVAAFSAKRVHDRTKERVDAVYGKYLLVMGFYFKFTYITYV